MEIDFGGIGKKYAVDRVVILAAAQDGAPSSSREDGTLLSIAIVH
jgi:thiamine biosynthesis lipoprotein ApbE